MQKLILLGIAAACITTSAAQKNAHEPYWLNPSVNRIGTETPRADFFAFESITGAQSGDKSESKRYMTLEGKWKFKFSKNHNEAPANFYLVNFDDSEWEDFPVPGIFELNGHGDATYKNVGYAWATQFKSNPPYVEEKNNYTGCYRKEITVPDNWKGDKYTCTWVRPPLTSVYG